MVVRKSSALFECIRDRFKRTGTGALQDMAKQPQLPHRFF
jgi:hypothetical protein